VREGGADAPDATIATDPRTLAAVLWHDGDPSALGVSGEEGAAASFLALFR